MLRKPSLIGAVAAALFFPIPASAGSAQKRGLTPVVSRSPTAVASASFTLIPVASTFIAGSKFHTNPGGKYVYPGWLAK